MNSFMSWVGGKKSLRDAVLARFPPYLAEESEGFCMIAKNPIPTEIGGSEVVTVEQKNKLSKQ